MIKNIETCTVDSVIKDSELDEHKGTSRNFSYKLNDKTAKRKLIQGAKRVPFDVKHNSSSCNLIFNLGSWSTIVLPSIHYWNNLDPNRNCKVGDSYVSILEVKVGRDMGGKHVDTQVEFLVDNDKVKLHCYNTTQLILVNGNGYEKLVNLFLQPFFEAKITNNAEAIDDYNENALSTLLLRKVKKPPASSRIVFKTRSSTVRNAVKNSPGTLITLPQFQSTRNNSFNESVLDENLTLNETYLPEIKNKEVFKFTCVECGFATKTKSLLDDHVETHHSVDKGKLEDEVRFVCVNCSHTFQKLDDFNAHTKHHGSSEKILASSINSNSALTLNEQNEVLVTTAHTANIVASNAEEEDQASGSSKEPICPFCELKENDLTSLMKHIEQLHKEVDAPKSPNSNDIEHGTTEKRIRCTDCSLVGTKSEIESHSLI